MPPPTTKHPHPKPVEPTTELLADWSRRYRPALTSYFRKRLRISGEVEDLVQEVFLRLARQHERLPPDPMVIAAAQATDRLRQTKSEPTAKRLL